MQDLVINISYQFTYSFRKSVTSYTLLLPYSYIVLIYPSTAPHPGPYHHSPFKTITMIIVHDTFVCKPGNASKLAKKFKEAMQGFSELKNIMTDMIVQFNRVILVTQYENLTAYEQSWKKYDEDTEANKKMQETMQGYQDMYLTGSREVFQVW
jgi:heme-degrading monooxygenase HmoA